MSRTGLATRVAVAALVVALLAAVAAALSATRLLGRDARTEARTSLGALADALALAVRDEPVGSWAELTADPRSSADVALVAVQPDGTLVGTGDGVRAAQRAGVSEPGTLSRAVALDRTVVLVEARPAGEAGLVLVQAYQPGLRTPATRAVVTASLIGLLGAGVAGAVLSGVVSRPLRRVAAMAGRMRAGERDQRAPVTGPAEVAEVAAALNDLAASLQASEARQRAFLHSVSHELRTPLTAIRGFAESIADQVAAGADAARAGATVLAEADRLDHLVGDLLDLARLGADDFRLDLLDVDLAELVTRAGEVWQLRGARTGVRVETHVPGPVPVRTDPRRVRQVIDALTDNAVRVTPAGAAVVLDLTAQADGITLQVRDGGPGLAPEDLPVAFERGVLHGRYAERAGSSGIGLSLVAALVERLGGAVAVGQAAEGGASFQVHLPGAAPHRPAQASG